MNTDALKSIIEDAHKLAKADIAPDLVQPAVETIALRLERLSNYFGNLADQAFRKATLKMPVISMPGKAAIKYHVDDPELPRLAASIETIKSDSGKVSCDCTLYVGNEVLADMQVYRGKTFAVQMVRHALKGAMSKLGKHRRMTANRQSREAAKKEGK